MLTPPDEPIDLGDGLTTFLVDRSVLRIDVFAWAKWYAEWSAQPPPGPYAHLDAVRGKVQAECKVELNHTQADALLHALIQACQDVKKKQEDSLTSPSSTG